MTRLLCVCLCHSVPKRASNIRVWFGLALSFSLALSIGCGEKAKEASNPIAALANNEAGSDPAASVADAMRRGDKTLARALIVQSIIVDPNNSQILEIAGDIESSDGKFGKAVEFYDSAINASSPPSRVVLEKCGRSYMALGRPFDALEKLETAVLHYPRDAAIRTDLAGLLAALGFEEKAGEHLRWLAMRGHAGVSELIMLSDLTRPQNDRATCEYSLKHYPTDLRPSYALSREDASRGQWERVAETLRPVASAYPEMAIVQAYYGRALIEIGDQTLVTKWLDTVGDGVKQESQYWIAVGVLAERAGKLDHAAAAFLQAARLHPDHGEALSRLAAVLSELGMVEQSRIVAARAGALATLRDTVALLHTRGNNSQQIAVQIAVMMKDLGRIWESAAWLRVGANMNRDPDSSLQATYANINKNLSATTPWQIPETLVASQLDFTVLPDIGAIVSVDSRVESERNPQDLSIRFSDQASQLNLNHLCKVARPPDGESGLWIYQAGAGAAAVLDYDLDGWPDLYLTSMEGTPMRDDSSPNQIFRNRNSEYLNVTQFAGVGDRGFSQGVAVADYNMDGFDDLYVANIGRNRLYKNNGDGTFSDVTNEVGLHGESWTTSTVLADIDQDGFVDLFEVGYCAGREALDKQCVDGGEAFACLPKSFSAEKDRIWQGQPNGTFVERTDQWLDGQQRAHGLGVVVGHFDEVPGIDMYVANDMSANHFWSASVDRDSQFKLTDQAAARGLAVDRRSLSQASMGIAAGDPDYTGVVDFYVTHFTQEYNTYYQQVRPGIWVDRTSQLNLAKPTLPLLAFGTQFVDTNNDGQQELIVGNGHLNDFRSKGEAYRMPSQLFHRSTDGTWESLSAEQVGDYFLTQRISRSVATLDANRDGKMDVVITHIFDPVSLLINESETTSQSITIYLKATTGHVDAIGARVSLRCGDKRMTSQLIGGNGYQCANQRCLHFGLGSNLVATDVIVEWQTGKRESVSNMQAGHEYLIIEDTGDVFQLSR